MYKNSICTKNTNIFFTQGSITKNYYVLKPHGKSKNIPQSRNQSGIFDCNILKLEVKTK